LPFECNLQPYTSANLASAAEGMDLHGRILAQQQATAQLTALQTTGVNVQATRHARRVYLGGITAEVDEAALKTFMEKAMQATGATRGVGGCVVSTYINREKLFCFVEFRTVEEASNCLAFDGLLYQGAALRWGSAR
jgi:splicing factor U2AF subunit